MLPRKRLRPPKPFFDTYNNCESNISWLDYVHSDAGENGLVIGNRQAR